MTMSLKEFKEFFLENILRFLWRQWSAMGLLGEARGEDNWVIDPEALLIFTLPIARYEPRLFDEVMDWLVVNGGRLDVQRVRTILKDKDETTHRLLGAILRAPSMGSKDRKWDGLIKYCSKKNSEKKWAPLFIDSEGAVEWFAPNVADQIFMEFGFSRGLIRTRALSREVKPNSKMLLRFLLRGLFGIGSRSECILYLITHEGGHPSEISEAIGTSYLATQQMLYELSSSGLVLTRTMVGKKIQYWVSHDRWWGFLSGPFGDFFKPPLYINWIALFNGLTGVWNAVSELEESKSDYIRSSKMRDAFDKVKNEFAKSGVAVPFVPDAEATPEAYEQAIQNFISQIFGK